MIETHDLMKPIGELMEQRRQLAMRDDRLRDRQQGSVLLAGGKLRAVWCEVTHAHAAPSQHAPRRTGKPSRTRGTALRAWRTEWAGDRQTLACVSLPFGPTPAGLLPFSVGQSSASQFRPRCDPLSNNYTGTRKLSKEWEKWDDGCVSATGRNYSSARDGPL